MVRKKEGLMDRTYTIHVRARWVRYVLVALVTALVAFPGGVWAFHSFSDVPDDSIFHSDISAIADAGVTLGFPDGTFRPKDFVTREQMAAFLNRGLALAPDKPPVAKAYFNPINSAACQFGDCPDGLALEIVPVLDLEVNAPGAGILQVSYLLQSSMTAPTGDLFQAWVALDQAANEGCGGWFFAPLNTVLGTYSATELDTPINIASLAGAAAVEVSAGTHTLVLCGLGNDPLTTEVGSLTTIWSQGGAVATPATASLSEEQLAPLRESLGEVEPQP
jgi:hypothetical protein